MIIVGQRISALGSEIKAYKKAIDIITQYSGKGVTDEK